MTVLPPAVDAAWLSRELGAPDLYVGDVRGPNAHARGHIPGSKPLVLGSPSPLTDDEVVQALAQEIGLRLRRHGVTGEERLVVYDRGDGTGAFAGAQLAELAGHPRVSVLVGGIAAWQGDVETGQVELTPVKARLEPNLGALPTWREVAERLGDLTLLDVRTPEEYTGRGGYPCDPRQGHIPGARRIDLDTLYEAPGEPRARDAIRGVLGLDDSSDVVAYCHSGSRSAAAALALRCAGYSVRNYPGSWHEWSRHPELPVER